MNATATAHGLDKNRVEPDWPPLQSDEVRALLRRYAGLGEPIEILSVSPRPFSAASVVQTNSRRVFVKRHHRTVRTRAGLLEEHRFLAHLYVHGAPVPRVLATVEDESAVEMGDWTYEVHETPKDIDIYEDALSWTPFLSSAHAYSAGQAMARLHRAAEGFNAPPRQPQPLVASFSIFAGTDPQAALERYLQARPALANDAATREHSVRALEFLTPFHGEIASLLPALKPLWTHNDLHASNLLWSEVGRDAQATRIIDFGLCDRTNAVHDLAQMIERNIVEWLELGPDNLSLDSASADGVPIHLDHLDALLDGYDSLRPLGDDEAAALAPMTALCHAEFALTEADYFLGVLDLKENARICAEDYLIGHAQWFRGPGGSCLLDAIRQWAENRKSNPLQERER
jgi:Ser/Thr protein kinase RdoA (MazF antagonist)